MGEFVHKLFSYIENIDEWRIIMKHWRKGLKRITAVALAVMMIGTTVDASALAVLAAEEVTELTCNHVCDETCGGMQAVTGSALSVCTHVHDEECGYEEAEAECTCGTDDPAFHATNCPAYIAPENPQCFCAEKCTDDTLNVWCDVCGVQGVSACQGTDTAATYAETPDFSTAKVLTAVDGALCIDGDSVSTMPAGNYKLTGDIATDTHIRTEGSINLDLNGYTWDMSAKYLFLNENVTLSLYDTSVNKTGKITSSSFHTIYLNGSGSTFNLYSGTVENSSDSVNAYGVSSDYGSSNLYGGTIQSNAYAVFYYLGQNITINIDNTSFDCGAGYAQICTFLASNEEPCAVIDVSDYTGGVLTVDAKINEAAVIKFFTGIQSAQDAENYKVNVSCDDNNKDFFMEKEEYEEDGGNKYVYVSVPSFTTQPTEENLYTVAFNHPNATLQWCEVTVYDSATYSEEHGKSYEVNAGDALIVSLSECSDDFCVDFDCRYNEEELFMILDSSRKTASVTFDSACSVNVVFMPSPFGTGEYKIEHVRYTELEGENGVQLSKTECETTYVCKATVGEREYCSDEVTIEQEHSYTCTATSTNVITKECDNCGKSGTLTITAEGGIYDGTTAYGATVIKTGILENEEVTVNYYQGDTLIGTNAPVNAGTYTAKITYEEVTASVTYTINTTPTADMFTYIESAVYDGTEKSANVVVKDGITGIGAITNIKYYQNGEATTPVNAGTYTVKIDVADGDIFDAATDIEVGTFTITKANPTLDMFTATPSSELVYDGTEKSIIVTTDKEGMGTFNVSYNPSQPVEAGYYIVRLHIEEGDNYNAVGTLSLGYFEIKKADSVISAAPTPIADLVYNGTSQNLINAGTTTDGEMQYSLDGTNYSSAIPTGIDAGEYTVWYKVDGDENHNDTTPASIEVTIAKVTPDIGTVSASNMVNTLDISQVVLSRSNETVPGTLSLADGTTLQYGIHDYTYVFTPNDNTNYETVTGTVSITITDTNPPTATYKVGTDGWKQFINTITFGHFCKDYTTVDITYSDEGSGVADKQYYISDVEITNTENFQWSEYTDTLNINATGKYYIYVRVTDNHGNEVIQNSEGIVVYAESVIAPTSHPHEYGDENNLYVNISTNGNTFANLTDGSGNEIATDNYSIDGSRLTIKGEYLSDLDVGEYTYKICMNPQGVENTEVTLAYSFVVNVVAKELTVTGATATSRDYIANDKTVDITGITLSGIQGTDDVSVEITGLKGTLSSANAGTYTSVILPTLTLTGDDAGNYEIVQPTSAVATDVTINKATPVSPETPEATAITYGDTLSSSVLDDSSWAWVDGTIVPNVSDYYNAYIEVDDSNYDYTGVYGYDSSNHRVVRDIVVIINRATLKITAKSYTIKVGEVLPTYEYTVTGLVDGDTLPVDVSLSCSATDNNAVGTYPITISGVVSDNILASHYVINYVDGTLTISEKDTQEITADDITLTYGETGKKISATTNGDGAITYTVATGTDVISVAADGTITVLKAGTATVTIRAAETADYAEATKTISVTVNKKKIAVPAVDTNGYIYTGTAQTYGVTSTDDYTVEGGVQTNAGEYPVTITLNNENYEWDGTLGAYKFVISKAAVTVTAKNYSIKVGEAIPTYAYDVAGLVNNETLPIDVAISCTATNSNTAGTYTITVSGAANSTNYTFAYVNGTLTVSNKLEQTIKASDVTLTYGEAGKKISATTNGDGAVSYTVATGTDVISVAADGTITALKAGTATVTINAAETADYAAAAKTISVTVNKAENAPNMPSATMNVPYETETVGAITLPDGWAWKAEDASKALTAGTAVTATAVYNGEDKGNYETETVEVAITRSACNHTFTSEVTKQPTIDAVGERTYTCGTCGYSYTEEIEKLEPTVTPIPTAVPTAIPTPGGGSYYPPYYPSYPTPTVRPTVTPIPTVMPTATPSATPSVSPTAVPTATPSVTPTPVPGTTTVPSSGETVVDENGDEVTSVVQEPGTTTKLSIPELTDGTPEEGEEAELVTWESSNPDVAEVDEDGNVTMKKPGLTEIVVTVGEGEDARRETIVVLVEEPRTYVNPLEEAFKDVRLGTSWNDIPLIRYQKVGETVDINFYGVKNWKQSNYEYIWQTSDESVAVVDGKGRVTALKPGVVELTLGLKNKADGHFLNVQSVEIVIPGDYENKILLGTSRNNTFDSIVLNLNERIDINFYGVKNWKKEDYEYYWSSSEPSVVWADSLGRLVPVNPGKAEIFLILVEKKNGEPRYVIPLEVTVPEK